MRQNHHGDLRVARTDALQELQAAKLRYLQVRNQNIHRRLFEKLESLLGVGGRMHLQPRLLRDFRAQIPRGYFRIDHQDRKPGPGILYPAFGWFELPMVGASILKTEHALCQFRSSSKTIDNQVLPRYLAKKYRTGVTLHTVWLCNHVKLQP